MNVLFEDGGKFHAGRIMSEAEASLQVELDSGKRQKIKSAQALVRFDKPTPAELMAWAQAQQEELDLDLLWEFAPEDEFAFDQVAADYYGGTPDAGQRAAILLRLFGAPHYFQRRGRGGQFRKAPAAQVQAALAAIARKQEQLRQIDAFAAELAAGRCPSDIADKLYAILFRPDKNSVEFKAVAQAVKNTGRGALTLLRDAGAITSAWRFHMQRFLMERFPKGTAFPELPIPPVSDLLPLAAAPAFSIDDSATTEIDDAFSLQWLDDGRVRLGIHIAAPALALTRDSDWERVARNRLSTVYMPGDKITMLPDALVQAFTLEAGRDCPALSLYCTVGPDLQPADFETRVEQVRIASNLRHDQLDAVVTEEALAADPAAQSYPHARELVWLWTFAQALKKGREQVRGKPERAGGVDYTFRIDGLEQGAETATVRIEPRRRGAPLDTIVAELMILANATWGGWLAELGMPGIYRSQSGFGANLRTRMGLKPAPHQGLGVAQYAWCTSPLRRYVDLLNQGQLIACARFGKTALLQAPFKPRDPLLFAIVESFEDTYKAYATHQSALERYWTLRYLAQEKLDTFDAAVLREGAVRVDGLPLVFTAVGAQDLPRNTRVRVQITGTDLITLEVFGRVIGQIEAPQQTAQADAGISADTEEEEDAVALAAPISVAVDTEEAEAEPGADASRQAS
ncbi:ribonuclease catalytic domain-containing protein [Thiomonas bhubaneswarensis]|uniref:Exoribonuclease R n=1 Tax=Thiomonas bhubaneswarensis TaxID=339866 RepID=A0A0K6HQ45_9BURK|nr:RNB domain-containing ribonuclease [Thiomonas bhubaneswarensis]CUA93004.1 Exoribonuclease R [Thiomonas bhubaneswarensis]